MLPPRYPEVRWSWPLRVVAILLALTIVALVLLLAEGWVR